MTHALSKRKLKPPTPPEKAIQTVVIDQQRLRALLHYDPASGEFTSLVTYGGRAKGSVCAQKRAKRGKRTYLKITLDGREYYAHRLVWLYVHGSFPAMMDHVDLDGTNNRLSNLRLCSRSQNQANIARPSNNTSGYKGCFWNSQKNRWHVNIKYNRRNKFVGFFHNLEEARIAYLNKAKEIFGEFARAE